MLSDYLQTRSIILDTGKTTLALELPYWSFMEQMAERDGHLSWRDFFYVCVLEGAPNDIPLSSWVRLKLSLFLAEELDDMRFRYLPEYRELRKMLAVIS